jgi:hypothetical protein
LQQSLHSSLPWAFSMANTFRALCADLLEAYEWCIDEYMTAPASEDTLVQRARAALAQPEPVAPTDEELLRLAAQAFGYAFTDGGIGGGESEFLAFARAALTRYGTPAIEPVPVSERLPEAGDWVWHCYAGVRFWEHGRYNGRQFFIGDGPESQPATHWLPANALPTPEANP